MKDETKGLFVAIGIVIVILALVLLLHGCHQPRADLTPKSDETIRDVLKDEKLIEKIYETNLLISGFIVVSAIGVFCCFSRQLQLGLALIATGGAGIWITRADQSLAQNQWFLLIPTGLLVVGGGIWVFKNERIRTALRQIIAGGQNFKIYMEHPKAQGGLTPSELFSKSHSGRQSKPTEKIVREIKAKL